MPPFPRRNSFRFRQAPQAYFCLPRLILQNIKALISCILPINPSRTSAHHFSIYIKRINIDATNSTPVPVGILHFDCNRLPEDQFRKFLFCTIAIGLCGFRCINLGKPYFDLLLARIEKGYCISISYSNNTPYVSWACTENGRKMVVNNTRKTLLLSS